MRFAAVIVAAGQSRRFGNENKVYASLNGIPVINHSLKKFLDSPDCAALVVVVPMGGITQAQSIIGDELMSLAGPRLIFSEGGEERADSVRSGLLALRVIDPEFVLVHDAARPFVSTKLIQAILEGTSRYGACIPGISPVDSIKRVDENGLITEHLDRSIMRSVQTPQGYKYHSLLSAYFSAGAKAAQASDDADVWALIGGTIVVIDGEVSNKKITFPEDLPQFHPI